MKPQHSREELQQLFHLSLNEAAQQLGISITLLKKQCRLVGIEAWPYRKLKKMAFSCPEETGLPKVYSFREYDATPKPKRKRAKKPPSNSNNNTSTFNTFPIPFEQQQQHGTTQSSCSCNNISNSSNLTDNAVHNSLHMLCTSDGVILCVDDHISALIGYEKHSVRHLRVQYLLHPCSIQAFNFTMLKMFMGHPPANQSIKMQRSDLKYVDVQVQISREPTSNCVSLRMVFPNHTNSWSTSGVLDIGPVLGKLRLSAKEVEEDLQRLVGMQPHSGFLWLLDRLYGTTSFISDNTFRESGLSDAQFTFPMTDPPFSIFVNADGIVMWCNRSYELLSGYSIVGVHVEDLEALSMTSVNSVTQSVAMQLPEMYEIQTPTLHVHRCCMKRSSRLRARRLDISSFAYQAEREYERSQHAAAQKLKPNSGDVHGYLWLIYLIAVEMLTEGGDGVWSPAKQQQAEILDKFALAKAERERLQLATT